MTTPIPSPKNGDVFHLGSPYPCKGDILVSSLQPIHESIGNSGYEPECPRHPLIGRSSRKGTKPPDGLLLMMPALLLMNNKAGDTCDGLGITPPRYSGAPTGLCPAQSSVYLGRKVIMNHSSRVYFFEFQLAKDIRH